jgi:hypothetical protein
MTEAEWLACDNLKKALAELQLKKSPRKFHLCAVACCRRVWHRITNDESRRALDEADLYADGRAAEVATRTSWILPNGSGADHAVVWASALVRGANGPHVAWPLWQCASIASADDPMPLEQRRLMHDIFGGPAHLIRAAVTPLTVTLGRAAYNERALPSGHLDNARLAVLSDALEEAGCADEAILSHLRSPGPHVRGCWALDLVLGKS